MATEDGKQHPTEMFSYEAYANTLTFTMRLAIMHSISSESKSSSYAKRER